MENLEQRKSSKIRKRSKEASTRAFPQVDSCVWKETKWKNAHKKIMRLYYWNKERICALEREGVSIIERGEREGAWVHIRTIKKKVYQALEFTSNGPSVFCRKKGWEEAYGLGL